MIDEALCQLPPSGGDAAVQLSPSEWVLELFHGPTLAFKDCAMQLLGRLMDHVLKARGQRATIVGATSAIQAARPSRPSRASTRWTW